MQLLEIARQHGVSACGLVENLIAKEGERVGVPSPSRARALALLDERRSSNKLPDGSGIFTF